MTQGCYDSLKLYTLFIMHLFHYAINKVWYHTFITFASDIIVVSCHCDVIIASCHCNVIIASCHCNVIIASCHCDVVLLFSAIKHAKENKVEYIYAKCALLEQMGDMKRVLFEGYQQILNVIPHSNAEKYVVLARDITKVSAQCVTLRKDIHCTKYLVQAW